MAAAPSPETLTPIADSVFGRLVPLHDDAVLIRSFFNRWRTIPQTVPGYASTQLLHSAPSLVTEWEEGGLRSYGALLNASLP